ncbi:GntR family transcriptional regulator [Microbacterium sp. Se63.02b]|uniref:GntR family transcriptional regulator n=1 Tax=Microbacterium sp. Se63.02b TaxID=2709304 RepID=UPI001605508F|nr:GntR family transcriptional regulator [Microbacterium sp. Se63.02b]QNA93181.1 GntR family transcriptional regulator [Microbacterium sp. Se63.02b]
MSEVLGRLREQILDGTYPVGSGLPSEVELAALHGVSRRTIRTALAALGRQGLVESHRGSGWFVQPSQPQGFDRMRSFTQWARSRGRAPGGLVVARGTRTATMREARLLAVRTDAQVMTFTRVRTLDGRPVMVERSTWAPWVLPHIADVADDIVSTTRVLADAGIVVSSGNHRIEAVPAGTEDARLLGVRRSSPLLQVRRETFATNGRPVECAEDRYVPHTISFEAQAFGAAAIPGDD